MAATVHINSEILTWAINRAGFDLPDYIDKHPRVQQWIEGKKVPTVRQLEDFSRKVYVPFGYFFLPEPPEEKLPIPYYRSNGKTGEKISVNVLDTIYLLLQRQDWLRDYLVDNDFEILPFVGRYRQSNDVHAIVKDLRSVLGLEEKWAARFRTWEEALNHLVETIEDQGIITVFNGVFENNNKRKIPVEECRGFVLVDNAAPFLFVNNSDFKSAQMFTIVHELAHIWTGQSAGFDFRKLQPADNPVEKLCDQVAAEFLVSQKAFEETWNQHQDTKVTARQFKVSEIVVARRALDTGKWSRKKFFEFYDKYKNREFHKKEKQSSGGDFYATAKKRLSITFTAHINQAVKSGQLLYRDAYKLTGLKGDTFENFFAELI